MSEPALPPPLAGQREGLQALLAQLGTVLLSSETIESTVELVTVLAGESIPGTAGAGVTVVDNRGKRSLAASHPLVEQADLLQYRLDAGPCLTAAVERTPVRIDDVGTDDRWPEWCAEVADLGVHSVLSVPLVAGGTGLGAIKVYSAERAAFDSRAERILELFARQAAVLLANTLTLADAHRTNSQLTDALQRRDVIGQAKGILLARGAADDSEAFAMLITASQRSNTKLHEVARRLVATTIEATGHDTTSAVD